MLMYISSFINQLKTCILVIAVLLPEIMMLLNAASLANEHQKHDLALNFDA